MTNRSRFCIITFFSIILVLLSSCSVKLNLKFHKDGSVDVFFDGGAGAAFSRMILVSTGNENAETFDVGEIARELEKNGFENVQIEANGVSSVKISMTDRNQSSFIFSSDIVKETGGKFDVDISRRSLKTIYDNADEQIKMILDLFVAPVFNDENLSENEYIETIQAFYGKEAASEVQNSSISINMSNDQRDQLKFEYKLSEFFCLK